MQTISDPRQIPVHIAKHTGISLENARLGWAAGGAFCELPSAFEPGSEAWYRAKWDYVAAAVGVIDATAIAAFELGVHVGEPHYETMLNRLTSWYAEVSASLAAN